MSKATVNPSDGLVWGYREDVLDVVVFSHALELTLESSDGFGCIG
jgi:hypothetical protein